jgi:hypothetical protein
MASHPPSEFGPIAGWPAAASPMVGAEQAADAVLKVLRLARGMAQAGRRVDLAGLDAMVGRLCARCLDLPPQDGRQIGAVLAALLVEIDALHASLPPR